MMMPTGGNDLKWYAFYLRSRAEKSVAARLADNGAEVFLPLVRTLKLWKDRKKWVEEPLLKSYLFVKTNPAGIYKTLQDNGVVKVINFTGQPAPIPDRQIEDLKRVISSGTEVTTTTEKFEQGDMVEITRGPLSGISGMLAEIKGKYRLILRIENMHHAILVTVHPGFVKKIKKT